MIRVRGKTWISYSRQERDGRLINADRIKVNDLEEAPFDDMFGEATGAGIIFGATGGVMEAALRSASFSPHR